MFFGWSYANYACKLLIKYPLQNECSSVAGFADPCIAIEITVLIVDTWSTIASKSQSKHYFIAWWTAHHHLMALVNQR